MFDINAINEMMLTQDERKIARHTIGDEPFVALVVDTCEVLDSPGRPYETAVSHVDYNPSQWCIVETYTTREEAEAGHQRWIERMIGTEPPDVLVDARLAEVGVTRIFKRKGEVNENPQRQIRPRDEL